MKQILLLIFLFTITSKISFSQQEKKEGHIFYVFNPYADAQKEIDQAMATIRKTHRHLIIIVGGDWNYWSKVFSGVISEAHDTDPRKFEVVNVNFSPANKNEAVLSKLKIPRDKGYPILVVLNENGEVLLATDTDDLKENRVHYSRPRVNAFISQWLTY